SCLSPPPDLYTLSLHDALPISAVSEQGGDLGLQVRADVLDVVGFVGLPQQQCRRAVCRKPRLGEEVRVARGHDAVGQQEAGMARSEEHTSELQSLAYLVCRLLL